MRYNNLKYKIFLTLLLLSSSLISAFAGKKYSFVFPENDFYPQYKVDTKIQNGFLPELLKYFAHDTKINIEIKSYPVKRYMANFLLDKADFVVPANPKWAPDTKKGFDITYSQSIMKSRVAFIIKKGKVFKTPRIIATIRGYTITPYLDQIKAGKIKVVYASKITQLLKLVESERVDAAFFHTSIALEKSTSKNLQIAEHLPYVEYDYHLMTIKHPKIVQKFNEWMSKNVVLVEKLKKKFFTINPILKSDLINGENLYTAFN